MFSEYASRFLAQSNFQEDPRNRSRTPLDRRRRMPSTSSNSRYVQRPGAQPHSRQASQVSQSRFPFASRLARNDPQAPLFFSATADYEDEGDDHDREVEDSYALQRSRAQFGGHSNLSESSELEDDGMMERTAGQNHDRFDGREEDKSRTRTSSESSPRSSKGKGRLVDISLESTIDEEPPESLARLSPDIDDDDDEPPMPFQPFRSHTKANLYSGFIPLETDDATQVLHPRPSSVAESVPPTVILPTEEPPRHDAFFANLFVICFCATFASWVLVWFGTSTPKVPIGDTIYTVIRASTNMLLWDTLFAVVISLIFFSLLRNYVRPLVYGMLVAVPVLLTTFSLYPFISSFKGAAHGATLQDRFMRYFSFLPLLFAIFWTYSVAKNRHSLDRAIQILEFSIKILASSPSLVALGFASLGAVIATSWGFLFMIERVFLSGHLSASKNFIISANSWWLGAFFVLMLLWTLGVIAGVQRATTAAVVSQWYFHRLAAPQPSSSEVVKASFLHSTGALFGTVCLSTFLSLMIRLPLIILPGRLSGMVGVLSYMCVPEGVALSVSPLTLSYAAVHSQPLGIAARGLAGLRLTSRTNPSSTLNAANLRGDYSTLMPYRLAKLILQATRWIASIALGFGGWVRVAHGMEIGGVRGSLYAYVVALIAATIGFAVLGAVENVLGGVIDAAFVCWGSESSGGRGEARFCREAGGLFGGDPVEDGWDGRRGEV